MKTQLIYIGSLMALAGSLLAGCQSVEKAESGKKRARKTVPPTYQIGEVVEQRLAPIMQLPGEFKAFQEVNLYPKASGFVEKVLVDRGSSVKKDQVLMVLEAPELEEQLVAARSKYLRAKVLLTASQDHYKRLLIGNRVAGSVSALDLETAKSRLRADSVALIGENANYQALQKIHSYLVVKAPFNGVITERHVHPGALVGSGAKFDQPMLVLQQQDRLRLLVDIPETYSSLVREGSGIAFRTNAMPGREFQGKVSRMAGSMNRQFRSETIEIDVSNPKRLFKPGMFAEIILSSSEAPETLVVPSSAVVTSTERQYVIKLDNNKARYIDVKQGHKEKGMTEVFGGIRANDKIIVNAREDIEEGTVIN
ncbi:hypothetical protein GCM10027347_07110 [Larkinella harenae]